MLYKRSTVICDDDWGHFIDIDDTQINRVSHKIAEPYYTTTTPFCIYNLLSETYLMSLEIPRIKDSCICSTFVTTLTIGSIMLCFIF
jgi:hypothetical protein